MPNINTWLADNGYEQAKRMTLTPHKLVTYLPEGSNYTSPSLTAGVPTKLLIPTTVKSINNFELFDKGGGDLAYRYIGEDAATFDVSMETSLTTATNNVTVEFDTYKNGIVEPGLSTERKVGTGADVGFMAITGEMTLNQFDYIELHAIVSLTSTVTFIKTSINICERN